MHIERNKGESLLSFPDDYCVVDAETTGHSPIYDDIIELAVLKVSNGVIVDKYATLIKPKCRYHSDNGEAMYVDEFITELTGITNEMLESAPAFSEIADDFLKFVGDSVIVGHNVNFDINFIYDAVLEAKGAEFHNDYFDLLRICRHVFRDYPNHRLGTVASELGVTVTGAHRSLTDCLTTFECLKKCREYIEKNNIVIKPQKKRVHTGGKIDLREITASKEDIDPTHPLFGKVCVFTGTLEKMKRADAAQLVVDFGGICENNVTAKTNFLILGNNDYCKSIKDGKSNKQKNAEKLILKGKDLKILPEDVFYDMLTE